MRRSVSNYRDWEDFLWHGDFDFVPATTTQIEVQFAIRCNDQPDGNNFVSVAKYWNRPASSSGVDLEGSDDNGQFPRSWIQVTERKLVDLPGSATPIANTQVTAIETL